MEELCKDMRRYNNLIKKIKKDYDKKLKSLFISEPDSVLAYLWYKRIFKTNISNERRNQIIAEARKEFNVNGLSNNEFISYLIEKQEKVKDLLQEFKTLFVKQLVDNQTTLTHVTSLSPKELGFVLKPHLAETIYNESIGNYVFATLEEVNKLCYAVRTSTGGMFNVGENMIVFPTKNNIEIKDGRLLLKKPIYSYSLDAKNFEPVITVRMDYLKSGKQPSIVFDDEWVSSEEININNAVCLKIEDVTDLLDYFKIFVYNDNNFEQNCKSAYNLTTKTKRDVKELLINLLKNKKITYINAELKQNLEVIKK